MCICVHCVHTHMCTCVCACVYVLHFVHSSTQSIALSECLTEIIVVVQLLLKCTSACKACLSGVGVSECSKAHSEDLPKENIVISDAIWRQFGAVSL